MWPYCLRQERIYHIRYYDKQQHIEDVMSRVQLCRAGLWHVTWVMMEPHHSGPLLAHSLAVSGAVSGRVSTSLPQASGMKPFRGPLTKGWADLAWEAPRKGLVP